MKLLCPIGRHEVKVRFNPAPGERFCPEHGRSLVSLPKGAGGQGKQGLPGEKAAKSRFRQVVCARPCFFLDRDEFGERRRPGHTCSYPLDAHHLIPKGWLKRNLSVPPEELVEVMWNPIIGAPLFRKAHDAVERSAAYVHRHELNPDLIAFCERFDSQHPDEPSLLSRLYMECPEREPVA